MPTRVPRGHHSSPKKIRENKTPSHTSVTGEKKKSARFFSTAQLQDLLIVSIFIYSIRVIGALFQAIGIVLDAVCSAFQNATLVLFDGFGSIFLSASKESTEGFNSFVKIIEFAVSLILYLGYLFTVIFVRIPRRFIREYRCALHPQPTKKKLLSLDVNIALIKARDSALPPPICRETQKILLPIQPFCPFSFPRAWHRRISFFSGACLLLAIVIFGLHALDPLLTKKDSAKISIQRGLSDIEQGVSLLQSQQFGSAHNSFVRGFNDFATAEATLRSLNSAFLDFASRIPGSPQTFAVGRHGVDAGKDIALIGGLFAEVAQPIGSKPITGETAYQSLDAVLHTLDRATPFFEDAARHLNAIDIRYLPRELRGPFEEKRNLFLKLKKQTTETKQLLTTIQSVLGAQQKMRYLVLFQNNNELRATGGFVGSFAILDVDRGKITNIEIPGGGPYDLQGSLRERVIAPQGLHLIKTEWQFQDSNWFPDFSTSAKKAMWFYEKSGGSSVDGVIALNASIVQSLLTFTGPIDMPAYGKVISHDNFFDETQKAVEFEYDRTENKPKKFIADLYPRIIEKLFSVQSRDMTLLGDVLVTAALARDIQLFAKNPKIQKELLLYGIDGSVQKKDGDYLMVVDTNVGGGKSDGSITRTLDRTIDIQTDGQIIENLTLRTEHRGPIGNQLTGKLNIDYARFYVPKGSALLSADGFQKIQASRFKTVPPGYTDDADLVSVEGGTNQDPATGIFSHLESGYTVFSQWIQTKPESVSTVHISYRLPYTVQSLKYLDKNGTQWYPVYQQRQSGSNIKTVNIAIRYPDGTVQEKTASPSTPSSQFQRSFELQNDLSIGFHINSLSYGSN